MRPATRQVLTPLDGRWWPADVLDRYRSRTDGHLRCVVRFTVAPGSTYLLAMPADRCRALPEQQQDQPYDARARHHQPEDDDDAPGRAD